MGMLDRLKEQFVDREDIDENEEYGEVSERPAPGASAAPVSARVPRVGSAAVPTNQARPYTMIVVGPKDYKDAEKIGDHIKQGRPVVMNIEQTEQNTAERIVDFVQGVMYALDGHMDRVSDTIYLCAPNNMTVSRESFSTYAAPVGGDSGTMPQPSWSMAKD